MTHPIKGLLDHIWNAGHTPKLLVDASHTAVVVPDSMREQWGIRLPIDLDAANPLNIEFDHVGIHADLAFNYNLMRCTLPWDHIYVIINRDTGESWTIPGNAPQGMKLTAEEREAAAPEEPKRPGLRVIKGGKSN